MLFHGSFSVVSGELPKIGTTGIELWFSDSFLSILFVCQGNISLNQKTPQKTKNNKQVGNHQPTEKSFLPKTSTFVLVFTRSEETMQGRDVHSS